LLVRFGVAKLMGIHPKEDIDLLDIVLAEMPCDDEWDVSIDMERGYQKAKLKRYHISASLLATHDLEEGTKEEISSSSLKQDQKSVQDAVGTSSSSGATVKLENPLLLQVQEEIKIVRSANPKLVVMMNQFKSMRATLDVKASQQSWWLRL
jgi:hypothetical protein